jgi:hypothetical protein
MENESPTLGDLKRVMLDQCFLGILQARSARQQTIGLCQDFCQGQQRHPTIHPLDAQILPDP